MQKRYISISSIQNLYFSGCSNCNNSCCDGSRFLFSPLILDDFKEVYSYFPIVFAYIEEEWRALIVMANENNTCHYYQEKGCIIYENRPPGCRLYPINPYFDDILIDTSCEAVNTKEGIFLASNKEINTNFYHERLKNFEMKRQQSNNYLQKLENQFEFIGEIAKIKLYKYSGEKKDSYIKMHHESIECFLEKMNL